MNVKIIVLALMLMTSIFAVGVVAPGPEAGPNYMGFSTSSQHRTIGGGTFTTTIWVNVHQAIDTVGLVNLTFLPAGKMNYTSQVKGNLFTQVINDNGWSDGLWVQPGGGGIHNAAGYVQQWAWGIYNPFPPPAATLNNSNGSLTTITWTPRSCGKVTLNIPTDPGGGTGTFIEGGPVGTTRYSMDIWIHPMAVTGFTATKQGGTQINLAWTKNTGDSRTLIRWRSDTYPTSITDGTSLYNSTGSSTSHTGLSPGDTRYYSAWGWNDSGSIYSQTYATAFATTNHAPTIGTPSPVNNSINQHKSFTWSVPITDSDGDSLTAWSIQCSNGQTTSGSGAGGTKSLSLSGLAYSTTYKVWVNASDATDTTRAWFQFTTMANIAPSFGTPSPTNGSTGRPYSFTWSIPVNDGNGDAFDWTIQCSNGQHNQANGATNGTKSLSLTGLGIHTWYTVWVNATDNGTYVRGVYTFTTVANQPPNTPGSGDPTPTSGASDVPIAIDYLRVLVRDPEGQTMTVRFYWGNGTLIGTASGVASGSTAAMGIPVLRYNTTYYWYVTITDSQGASTRGPTSGNWSYFTEYPATGGGGNPVVFHNVFITVVDTTTNLPIQNAYISAKHPNAEQENDQNHLWISGFTDQYGTFSAYLKDNHNYALNVTKVGYNTYLSSFSIAHADVYITVRMTPTPGVALQSQGVLTNYGWLALIGAVIVVLLLAYIWSKKK